MTSSLLKTKLYAPAERYDWIVRPHLFQRLDAGLSRPFTLVSAPAGYGKTTLLSSWLNKLSLPAGWLTLDDGDNDPVLFLFYLIAALQKVNPELGEGLISALQTPQPIDFESFMTALINQIVSTPDRFVMVLDDYHILTAHAVHTIVSFLLDHQPQNMHLVIATRNDPPFPLARFRGRGQITEIRQHDLKVFHEEAVKLVTKIVGEDIENEHVHALNYRTEGWITGLKLAALSLRIADDKPAFILDFSGRDTLIADYLTDEVLKQLPEDIQTFLLQTSILDRLSDELCQEVTRQQNCQKTIQWLQNANLFVISLDNQQVWYRYHQLFADLLRNRLYLSQPTLTSDLHLRASQWYEREGHIEKAIDHAIEARNLDRAAGLVEKSAEASLMDGRVATFLRWVEALPEEIRNQNLAISVYYILLLFWRGTPPIEILRLLEQVEKADRNDSVTGEISLIRAYVGLDRAQSYQFSQRALELIPLDRTYFRGFATSYYGLIQIMRGELEIAQQTFSEVIRASRRAENTFMTVLAFCRLADIAMFRGQLHESEALFKQALEASKDRQGKIQHLSGEPLIGLGRVHYEWNELAKAKQLLTQGIEMAGVIGETRTLIAYITLAHVWLLEGDLHTAHQAMLRAQLIAENSSNTEVHLLGFRSNKVRFEILQGDLESALHWVDQNELLSQIDREDLQEDLRTTSFPFLRALEVLCFAMLKSAQGSYHAALELLHPLLVLASEAGWTRDVLFILIQQALVFRELGNPEDALACLGKALTTAEPEVFVRPFIEQGRPMFELLHQAAGRGMLPEFTHRLLSEFRKAKRPMNDSADIGDDQSLVEPLTTREIEIVRLLEEGHSNKRIAECLVISAGTVKKHLTNIYGKLGAHNRTEAVALAREFNLL